VSTTIEVVKRALLTLALLAGFAASASAGTPTKASYIKQADRICKRAEVNVGLLIAKFYKLKHPGAVAAEQVAAKESTLYLATDRMLMALPKPPTDRSTLNRLWAMLHKLALGGGSAGSAMLSVIAYEGRAQAFGFKACGDMLTPS
jgi:hypothetical protein